MVQAQQEKTDSEKTEKTEVSIGTYQAKLLLL